MLRLKITPFRLIGIAAMLALGIAVLIPVMLTLSENDGRVIYCLDDPYIHLSVAKNLALHGVWGVTPYEFSSSTSSIGYPLLLALGVWLMGSHEWLPLFFNLLGAAVLIYLLYIMGRDSQFSIAGMIALMAGVLVLVPLSMQVLMGMEHIWQAALNLAFIWMIARALSEDRPSPRFWHLALMAFLVVMARYEGLFIVGLAVLGLLWQGSYYKAIGISAAALLPVVGFGIYSLLQEGTFFPNSLLIKGQRPLENSLIELIRYAYLWLKTLYHHPYLQVLVLGVSAAFVFLRPPKKMRVGDWMAVFFVLTTIFQLQVAGYWGHFRYFSYLIVIAWFIWVWYGERLTWSFSPKWALGLAFLMLLTAYPMMRNSVVLFKYTPQAMRNIFQQQIQMADFLKENYNQAAVAANDIGAITYFTNIQLLDMVGLGSNDVSAEKLRTGGGGCPKTPMAPFYEQAAENRNVQLAIIYDSWFDGCIPHSWRKVGQWTIPNNVTCGDSVVFFYAVAQNEDERLMDNLRAFSAHLPAMVKEHGQYLETKNKF